MTEGATPGRVEIFLASRNPKKLDEMKRILGERLPGIEVLGLDDVTGYQEPVEDQPDFAGNALVKARAVSCLACGPDTPMRSFATRRDQ